MRERACLHTLMITAKARFFKREFGTAPRTTRFRCAACERAGEDSAPPAPPALPRTRPFDPLRLCRARARIQPVERRVTHSVEKSPPQAAGILSFEFRVLWPPLSRSSPRRSRCRSSPPATGLRRCRRAGAPPRRNFCSPHPFSRCPRSRRARRRQSAPPP